MFTSSDSLNQFLHYASTTTTSAILNQRQQLLQQLPVIYRRAAVLMPFDWNHGATQIWLSQRSKQLRQHSGQIAFPGGKLEDNENSITAAFRESAEEAGLIRSQWHLAGTLPPCYLPSGFKVVPVLAWSSAHLQWQLNHAEVSEIFAIPLSIVLDSSQYQQSIMRYQQHRLPVYHLHYQHWHIWGATACMLLHVAQCYEAWYRQMTSVL
ncbi:NUDIX hydrolase [Snodgrassella gandavensis]|uniref:NUDIX hydrolase n=1 Tax=Snodgrassella gandavensis TaxID=2946698 RepID=UPI001EF448DD|nr:CoA pyrophosphatase [Snodgrassella gandavensis]